MILDPEHRSEQAEEGSRHRGKGVEYCLLHDRPCQPHPGWRRFHDCKGSNMGYSRIRVAIKHHEQPGQSSWSLMVVRAQHTMWVVHQSWSLQASLRPGRAAPLLSRLMVSICLCSSIEKTVENGCRGRTTATTQLIADIFEMRLGLAPARSARGPIMATCNPSQSTVTVGKLLYCF
ncbi:MAG: hypothetical protein JWO94_3841 [Verrucomicrobiaceae bacterium]|nr:hypothetical protein [Verrucomicrobiaceae bacterium]